MNIIFQNEPIPSRSSPFFKTNGESDRRADIDAKQARVADMLRGVGCDGLLVLDPDNFAWLSRGAIARGVLDPAAYPCLYFTAEGRWLISSNVDTQRVFDEELDGLGFQMKEWPWQWGRAQLLADLLQGRKVASDLPVGECTVVGDALRQM